MRAKLELAAFLVIRYGVLKQVPMRRVRLTLDACRRLQQDRSPKFQIDQANGFPS